MRSITETSELRSVQIGVLDCIADVCRRHAINYSLSSGTLIGALRHKGYIPWDDDIDLYMLRSDYERFVAVFNREQREQGSPYELLTPETAGDRYLYTYGKVTDTRTMMVEDEATEFPIGVYVDIFPLDYAHEDEDRRRRQFRWRDLLNKIRCCKKLSTCCLRSRLAYLCYRYLPLPLAAVEWLQRRKVFLRRPTSLVCNLHTTDVVYTSAFPVEAMQTFTTAEFEGKQYQIMGGYDTYLRRTYKFHYMTLPPEDQRVHHHFKAWWKE